MKSIAWQVKLCDLYNYGFMATTKTIKLKRETRLLHFNVFHADLDKPYIDLESRLCFVCVLDTICEFSVNLKPWGKEREGWRVFL